MLGLSEALAELRSPYLREEFSPLGGRSLLVVDLEGDAGVAGAESLLFAREALAALPCPSVAIRAGAPSAAARHLESRFDVVVASPDEVEPLRRSVAEAPLAAMALVQLLRQTENLDVESGLLAESFVYSALQSGPEFAAWLAAQPERPALGADDAAPVRVERDGARLLLTLDRPECHNAYDRAMRDALVEGLRVAECDASILEVELRGAGPSFCSGGDLREFGTLPDPVTAHAVRSTRNAARLLAALAHRVQVRVHGACIGAGAELAAFAGRVRARADARFALPELGMGLVPGAGGTVSIPRRIGRQRAAWLALSRQSIDAALAWRWGLVDELC